MALYRALNRVVLPKGIVEKDACFESDLVPGSQWDPQDEDAKSAVARRDAAEAAEAEAAEPDDLQAKLAQVEVELADATAEIADLTAKLEAAQKAPPPADKAKRAEDIEAAIALLDDENDLVKTGERAGRPKCSAVEKIVGYPVFTDEVDAAWAKRSAA